MTTLLSWLPDEFLIVAIMIIGVGVVTGFIRAGRAMGMIGSLILLALLSPFVEALWNTLPGWLCAVLTLAAAVSSLRTLSGWISGRY